MRLLVFSDLDESLLDSRDYHFAGAQEALERLKSEHVPLILVTSKTRAEVEPIRERLGITGPFVVENGGGVFFPAGGPWPIAGVAGVEGGVGKVSLGVPYTFVRAFLEALPPRVRVRGFGDMSPEEIRERTGLSLEEACRARQRQFSEPVLSPPPEVLGELAKRAERHGLQVVEGGRFHHLMGSGHDKGAGLRVVREAYEVFWGERVATIGVGDSPNDLPMLQVVDVPVIVPRASGPALTLKGRRAILAGCAGSRGWNESVLEALQSLRSGRRPTRPEVGRER